MVILELQVLLLWVVEELCVDLLGDDLRADEILLRQAQTHLFEDELDLLALVHRSVGLDLEGFHDVGSAENVTVGFFDVGQDFCQAGALDFNVDLALGDCSQCVDELDLGLLVWSLVDVGDAFLHHLNNGLFRLRTFLHENCNVLVQQVPLADIENDLNDGDEHSRAGNHVGANTSLLLEREQLFQCVVELRLVLRHFLAFWDGFVTGTAVVDFHLDDSAALVGRDGWIECVHFFYKEVKFITKNRQIIVPG